MARRDRQNRSPAQASILLIDDDIDMAALVEQVIHERARVVMAHCWTDAKAILDRQRFALILLDLYLPDAGRLEPLEHIRRQDPDCPVILMSGNIDYADPLVDRAMSLGVDTVLRKPFAMDALEERLRPFLPDAQERR